MSESGRLKLRRGTNEERLQIVFEPGEPVYTTDTKKLYIGDGVTPGGVDPTVALSVVWGDINEKPTTIGGFGITDAYTKSETNTALALKADTTHTHDDRYYTESESDDRFAPLDHVGSGGVAHAVATQSVAGFLSASDKTKLDGFDRGVSQMSKTLQYTVTAGGDTCWPLFKCDPSGGRDGVAVITITARVSTESILLRFVWTPYDSPYVDWKSLVAVSSTPSSHLHAAFNFGTGQKQIVFLAMPPEYYDTLVGSTLFITVDISSTGDFEFSVPSGNISLDEFSGSSSYWAGDSSVKMNMIYAGVTGVFPRKSGVSTFYINAPVFLGTTSLVRLPYGTTSGIDNTPTPPSSTRQLALEWVRNDASGHHETRLVMQGYEDADGGQWSIGFDVANNAINYYKNISGAWSKLGTLAWSANGFYDTVASDTRFAPLGHIGSGGAAHAVATETTAGFVGAYKEDVFTPVARGETSYGTGTYTTQSGTYTRIGNRCFFELTLSWTAHTGTGVLFVAGFPYTPTKSAPVAVWIDSCIPGAGKLVQGIIDTYGIARFTLLDQATGTSSFPSIDTAMTLQISGSFKI